MGVPCGVVVAREEGVGHRAAGAVEGVAVVVVSCGEVDLDVGGTAGHLVEVQGCEVAPDFERVVHERAYRVAAQGRVPRERADPGAGGVRAGSVAGSVAGTGPVPLPQAGARSLEQLAPGGLGWGRTGALIWKWGLQT